MGKAWERMLRGGQKERTPFGKGSFQRCPKIKSGKNARLISILSAVLNEVRTFFEGEEGLSCYAIAVSAPGVIGDPPYQNLNSFQVPAYFTTIRDAIHSV